MTIDVLDGLGRKVAKGKQAGFVTELGDELIEIEPTQLLELQEQRTAVSAVFLNTMHRYFSLYWHTSEVSSIANLLDVVWQRDEDKTVSREPSEEELLDSWDRYLEEHWDELAARYRGKYVAIWKDIVSDSDEDLAALATRVYATLGYRPIFMPYIGEKEQVYEFTSPF